MGIRPSPLPVNMLLFEKPMHPVPIILAAFGTAAKTRASYEFLGNHIKHQFPDHEIFWAWSSRIIKDKTLGAPQQANLNGQMGINTGTQPKLDCFPKDTITPQELMPREDATNVWQ